ncbi:hypothetical protein [Methanomassiliicoccus luminyensis]|jgi:uncharacterized membrane protein|uniref:hypothetical protein n=1 Tax=Methanomassiliicoccus luminyensis TaxID=1080712 RepID=UPI00036D9412|nr:hypothetical protein [Methanomassiliicoccus luminyensis]
MALTGGTRYNLTGLVTAFIGIVVLFIGSRTSWDIQLANTYATDFYWDIAFAIVGAGLVLIGVFVIIIGVLNQHEVPDD